MSQMVGLNGRLLPAGQAHLSPFDRGFLLGDGLFETLRAYRGSSFRLESHLERLEAGAQALGIPLPYGVEEIHKMILDVREANRLLEVDSAIRLTLSRGIGPRGLLPPEEPAPVFLVTAFALADAAPPPARAMILQSMQRNPHSPLAGLKTLNYLENVLARREAQDNGMDEAIFLNTSGALTEASAANLFLVIDGMLHTPPLTDGVLPGITRAVTLELAQKEGIPVREHTLWPDVLRAASEAFLTNSLVELRPLVEVDGVTIGNGAEGEITRRLQAAYRLLVEQS